jgi:hypothetical protein
MKKIGKFEILAKLDQTRRSANFAVLAAVLQTSGQAGSVEEARRFDRRAIDRHYRWKRRRHKTANHLESAS